MAITVGINTFVSLEFANGYYSLANSPIWSSATNEAKEAALVSATAILDTKNWIGKKSGGRDQHLSWPRTGVVDSDGNAVEEDETPIEVQKACCEFALRELESPGSVMPDAKGGPKVVREKVDVIEIEYSINNKAGSELPVINKAEALIKQFIKSSSTTFVGRS